MRRLIHLVFQPASRLVRLALGEKRLVVDPQMADDTHAHMPQFIDLDGTTVTGLWAILDHIEGTYPEIPLVPDDAVERGEALRWLDWTATVLGDQVTRKIVSEKANPRYTGTPTRSTPDVNVIRAGRDALRELIPFLGKTVDEHGNLVSRNLTIADLSLAAHLSSLDYFGEVPWDANQGLREWYMRMKSRPSFRSLLADRVPGQPPIKYYADLDF
ncbi:glutathione S-transferase family protein [Rhizomicrobium electricum]|jgi:glutathione S-transferase|uniref:FtsZ-binding protein FzlA n=1 Tax=Rhizomicrobium electricum TaxID=480070 RepID=A0ABP3PD55_9PROT|nr:glutathione S-transferase family protein [Rhizomicrobium electricum]NIJ48065.1 glutathione S-transferase [Rhizomicrobium electricum]